MYCVHTYFKHAYFSSGIINLDQGGMKKLWTLGAVYRILSNYSAKKK